MQLAVLLEFVVRLFFAGTLAYWVTLCARLPAMWVQPLWVVIAVPILWPAVGCWRRQLRVPVERCGFLFGVASLALAWGTLQLVTRAEDCDDHITLHRALWQLPRLAQPFALHDRGMASRGCRRCRRSMWRPRMSRSWPCWLTIWVWTRSGRIRTPAHSWPAPCCPSCSPCFLGVFASGRVRRWRLPQWPWDSCSSTGAAGPGGASHSGGWRCGCGRRRTRSGSLACPWPTGGPCASWHGRCWDVT